MLNVNKKLKITTGSLALMAGLAAPMTALADEVVLRSTDGTINVTGELVGVSDGSYVLTTPLGELSIAVSRVVCEGVACPVFETAKADVTIVGSESMGLRLMPLLMNGYATSLDAEAEVVNTTRERAVATLISDGGFGDEVGSFAINAFGDTEAFKALLDKQATLGMSSRRIVVEEARALRDSGSESMVGQSQERIIAVDPVVVVTHAENPVQTLTNDQLRGIFSGKVTNWSQVGGEDHKIQIVSYPEDSSNYSFFMSYLFGEDFPKLNPAAIASDDQAASNVVYLDKHSIGYVGYGFLRGSKPLTLINECGLPMTPDALSAKTEEYSLSRRLYMYNRGDTLDDKSRAFLDFATSEAADDVILKSGFVDLSIERRPQQGNDPRRAALEKAQRSYATGFEGGLMGEMVTMMDANERLSTTIYYRIGSDRIDPRGQADMARLIRYLKDEPAGTKVTFVGFTDDVGAFEANRKLSGDRAKQIAQAVASMAGSSLPNVKFETAGFGAIAPNACNVTEQGRAINRRVEVWISNGDNS